MNMKIKQKNPQYTFNNSKEKKQIILETLDFHSFS
jgi:hypothetical protein